MNTIARRSERLLTTFGLGYCKPASGTWGSLPPVILAGGLAFGDLTNSTTRGVYDILMIVLFLVFSAACVLWGTDAEARWSKDPGQVVADETAGQCVTLLMIPTVLFTGTQSTILTLLGAFLLFRAFDILKPWPAGAMQKIPGGWGILLDDWIAGFMAGIVIWIVFWIS